MLWQSITLFNGHACMHLFMLHTCMATDNTIKQIHQSINQAYAYDKSQILFEQSHETLLAHFHRV